LTLAAKQAIDAEELRPVGAGLLGAGMAVAFMIILFLVVYFLGFIQCGKKLKRSLKAGSDVCYFSYGAIIYLIHCCHLQDGSDLKV